MSLKFGKEEISAALIVFLLSLGFWHFPAKQTLPDFNTAMAIQRLPELSALQPPHLQAAHFAYGAYASLAGLSSSSPQAIISFLLVFPSLILALSSLFLYLAMRQLGLGKSASLLAMLLFALSLSAMEFLPGLYKSAAFASLPFSLFLLCFSHFRSSYSPIALLAALLFAFLSSFFDANFGLAGILLLLSFALADAEKGVKGLMKYAALGIPFVAGSLLSYNLQYLSFAFQESQLLFSVAPFLLAASSCAAVLCFFREARKEHLFLFISGIIASFSSPLAGALLLAMPAAEGIRQAASEKLYSRVAQLACAYFLAFFAVLGLAYPLAGAVRAAAIAFLLSFLFPLMVHFYGYKNRQIFSVAGICLLALSASLALFYQLSPAMGIYPQYLDRDIADALISIGGKGASGIALIGNQDAARLYLPTSYLQSQSELSEYLKGGKNPPPPGTYLLLSLSHFDDKSAPQEGYDAYFFYSNLTSSGRQYAQFVSISSGTVLVRELDLGGGFSLKDGQLIDQSGRAYASVPLSRMLVLRQDIPFYSAQNRILVLEEGEALPHFLAIYSGRDLNLEKVSEHGKVAVFRVK